MLRSMRSRWFRPRGIAILIALLILGSGLAACGQAAASRGGGGTPSATGPRATPVYTVTPLPIRFSKQWVEAPVSGMALNQLAFAPSDPTRGYVCDPLKGPWGATAKPFAATSDGGVTWTLAAGAPFGTSGCAVFVDQANPADVFVQLSGQQLVSWRSRDGGATWLKLSPVTLNQVEMPWTGVAVVGARIVITVGAPETPDGPGQLPPNDLFASDDGGATWQQIGQSIAGQGLDVRNLISFGSTLIVRAHEAGGCCGDAAPLAPAAGAAPLGETLSGGPAPNLYWRSTDGGRTWTQMQLPAQHIVTLRFMPSPIQSHYYGVAFADNVDPTNATAGIIYYTDDSGAHWQQILPVEPYLFAGVDPGTVGADGNLVVLQDGSIVASFWHASADAVNALPDAGVLRTRVDMTSWLALAPGSTSGWQLSQTSTGTRLWGFATSGGPPALNYITIDPITT